MARARAGGERQVTLAEAASALRVSYFQAHQMMLFGRLEGVRRGHRWLVTASSVERVAASKGEEPENA